MNKKPEKYYLIILLSVKMTIITLTEDMHVLILQKQQIGWQKRISNNKNRQAIKLASKFLNVPKAVLIYYKSKGINSKFFIGIRTTNNNLCWRIFKLASDIS